MVKQVKFIYCEVIKHMAIIINGEQLIYSHLRKCYSADRLHLIVTTMIT